MKNLFTVLLIALSFLLNAQSPNIVLILADDMGWNGTEVQLISGNSSSASDFYETPNLQELASQGMVFSQGYAPAAKCSPSRNSILTGESPARNSFTETGNGIEPDEVLIEPLTETTIDSDDQTIAEWLKSLNLNYQTAHYGKWHLGSGGPAAHGFDYGDGATTNTQGTAANGEVIQEDPKTMFELTEKGVNFMEDAVNNGAPFFLQISHYAVHTGIETTQESFDHFEAKAPGAIHDNVEFAGMTKDLDYSIEILLQKINDLEIDDETYVIFLSDNGAGVASNNAPLREQKAYIFEGGIRVPFIIRGPGIPAGTFSTAAVHGYDLFPTIAEWTGNNAALPPTIDGESIVPLLTQNSFTRNEPLYFHIPHYSGNANKKPRSAAVDENYKLIVEYDTGIDYLYDLDTDIGESNNIASLHPLVVQELKIKLRDHLKTVNANMPTLNPDHPNFSGSGNDVDNDGLDDEWEFTELLSYHFSATDDPDNDGDDNLTEYMNGTDPLVGSGSGPTTVVISEGGFESGWEIWNAPPGPDSRRNINDAPFANSGSFCVRLRDNDPTASYITSDILDLTAFDELSVDFSFITQNFSASEDFWFQLSTDGGLTFTTMNDWVNGVDFENDVRETPSITLNGPFTSETVLRFRCDASRNSDVLYIDDVVVTGLTPFSNFDVSNLIVPISNESTELETNNISISNLNLFPNPTNGKLNITYSLSENTELNLLVTNLFGEIIFENKWTAEKGSQYKELNLENAAQGYYFVQLITPNNKLSEKIIVTN